VGLWCDALFEGKEEEKYDDFVLLNDSLFALRPYTKILDALREGNSTNPNQRHMTSLSYSMTDSNGIWLESAYRAFDKYGINVFMNHSCHDRNHESFCHHVRDSREKKRCIVNYHEIAVARLFQPSQVKGLYLSDVPESMWKPGKSFQTWATHTEYWKSVLVETQNFPAAKVTKRNMIKTMKNPLIQTCTAKLNRSIFEENDAFNFSAAVLTIQKNS